MVRSNTRGNTGYTVLGKKGDNAYSIGLRQWRRLRKDIDNIPESFDWWTVLWSTSFGAATSFLGVALTASQSRGWYWSLSAIFFVSFLVILFSSRSLSKIIGSSKENALNRMTEIEEDHESPTDFSG